jgi:HYDIN/CFA65/VesB family protein/putative pyrroloquinoline-quinone binding quinoprotein/putative pyrroloquinoline-quinone-binding quinoprotein
MRHRSLAIVATLALALAAVQVAGLPPRGDSSARADVVTVSQNNLRTGWDQSEPDLAPVSDGGPVGGSGFGELFEAHLNGQIYGQPLVVGQMLIVATETNHVYGLNAVTGKVLWSDYLGRPEPWTAIGCTDLTPDIGITSSPVYDPASGTVYLVGVVNNGPTPSQPHVDAFALSAQTGKPRPGWPVAIHGSPVNDPQAVFNPFSERQRAGLLLLNGRLYAGFAAYCDYQPYLGYVAGVDTASRALTLWSDEAGLTSSQGGIWQGGGGLMSDGPGRIFVATGNGVSPPPGPGEAPPQELGDSVVRLNVAGDGTLSAADFFSPANAPTLDDDDEDFGAGGPVGLPFGTASDPALLVQAGKTGLVFLLNRDDLGGREQGAGGTDDMVSVSGPYGGQWGHPAAFGPDATVAAATSADYVYYVGANDVMRYLQFGASASGTAVLSDVANSSTTFGYTSGSPVVTSNGNDLASAVVWEVDAPGPQGTGASLQAFSAEPASTCTAAAPCTMTPLWSAPIGTASKFSVPATDGGRVYVGTRAGDVFAFGSPDAAPLASAPVNFGRVAVGGRPRAETVTVTASVSVRVTGLSVAAAPGHSPFRLGAARIGKAAARFPVTLAAGEALTVPVTFGPVRAGGVAAALAVATTAANFPSVSVSLTGQGTAPGLQASPASLSFGRWPAGTTVTKTVLVSNASTAAESITAVGRPRAPFSATLPARGRIVKPGQSVAVQVTFRPRDIRSSTSSVTIRTSARHVLRVSLAGAGKAAISRVTAGPAVVRFGAVQLGQRATRRIVIRNDGNLPAVISGASVLTAPFGTQVPGVTGLPLTPRYTAAVPVAFTPSSTGPVTSRYVLRWHDAAGRHAVSVVLTGTGVAPRGRRAVPPPGGGWTFNGPAGMHGQQLILATGAKPGSQAEGSAIYAVPESSRHLVVSFTATLGASATLTLSLLPGTASPEAIGGPHGGHSVLGRLRGVAFVLATHSGKGSGGLVGVAAGIPGGVRYLASKAVPGLSAGAHLVSASVTGRRIVVWLDRKRLLTVQAGMSFPARTVLAFTGVSSSADPAAVHAISIAAGGRAVPPPGGGWSFNGSAGMSASAGRLTRAARDEAGAVIYPVAVPVNGLKVTFTAQLSGGSGANGLTLALLRPAAVTAASVGGDGTSLGLGGLPGTGVALNTVQIDDDGTNNNAEIVTSTAGHAALTVQQQAEAIPPLRPGPDTVSVQVGRHGSGYVLTVWLDGEQILQQAAPELGPTALLAFTGSTGSLTDLHVVRDVAISVPG